MTKTKRKGLMAKTKEAVAATKTGRKVGAKAAGSATKTPRAAKPKKDTTERKARVKAEGSGKHRDGTKRAQLIEMLKRKGGASGEEIQIAMKWLAHSTRGALSTMRSKGIPITAEREGGRGTVYRITG